MDSGSRIRLILWKAEKAVSKLDRQSIAETGLHLSEFAILEVLLHKGALPIKSIGQKVLLTSGSMTAALNRLEKKSLVQRIPDPMDGRSFQIHLTDDGHQLIRKAYGKHSGNLEKLASCLSTAERSTLVRLLKKIGYQAEKMSI